MLRDGFALQTVEVVNLEVLESIQNVIANYHPDAAVNLGGDAGTPLFGLQIHVGAERIYIAWQNEEKLACLNRLNKIGVYLSER